MKKLSILILTTLTCLPTAIQAAEGMGSFYTNVGATLVTHNSNNESAYFIEVGHTQKLSKFLSADVSYKKVETFKSSVSANSDEFAQAYDAYALGLRVDQQVGYLSLFGAAGASYITSETTTWDTDSGAEKVDNDDALKPYASAGVSLATPYDRRLTLDMAINYQMLPNDEYATSLSAGVNFAL